MPIPETIAQLRELGDNPETQSAWARRLDEMEEQGIDPDQAEDRAPGLKSLARPFSR